MLRFNRIVPNESEIISRLKKRTKINDQVLVGIGDDAAVIKTTGDTDLVACCDLMVEGVHFRTEWTTPRLLGRKALAVNLSDVAAMGALSKFAMISIALPHRYSAEFIDELFAGISELAEKVGVAIIGGDTSSSLQALFIDVSIIGECQNGKAVTRHGAQIGDKIYVSGSLGASALGLSFLEAGFRLSDVRDMGDTGQQAVLKHLAPEPRVRLGRALGESELATAMIDISDGLSTDLTHILEESSVGATIHASALPIHTCVMSAAESISVLDPTMLALNGGEEYELLFTARPEDHDRLIFLAKTLGEKVTQIGEIDGGEELRLERNGQIETIQPSGYEHII
jgi:thiamine-monophosphate kinase